jgi:D-alanyl-D-alanine carboxypeptidase
VKSLDDHLEAALAEGAPGAVVLAADGSSTWQKATGSADVSTGTPMTPAHRFRIASVTKLFTATVVLQLVDEGTLALDAEVRSIEGGVTVRQLLNHTSGLQNFAEIDALFAPYREDRAHRSELTPREVLALIEKTPRLFEPGEGWFYTGSNYVVLGLLVEETTGAPLREELRRRIIDPLGLADTDLPDAFLTAGGLARGYLPADNPLLPDPGPDPIDVTDVDIFSWGGGGMVSTAQDIGRFLRALLGGELLSPAMRRELLTTVPADWEESVGYGLGIEEVTSVMGQGESPCGPAWGHLGFAPGYTTIALASEDGDRQVVILANTVFMSEEPWKGLAELTWACFCGSPGQTSV